MFRVALRLTRDRQDAEDLVSEATLLAWQNFAKIESHNKFKPWILRILTNKFISLYRQKKIRPQPVIAKDREEAEEFSLFEALSSPFLFWNTNPEKIFLDNLLKRDIVRAVDSLPDEYRIVVTLCIFEDLPYQKTAEILDIPVGTVRSRLHRGKSILQKRLYDYAKEKGYLKRRL